MIPDEVIEQIRESADIVGIIGEYVPLKRTGSDFRGPCPFHQGTRRNFSVVPAKRLYHCFVCGESGDVFKFLTKRLGVDWPEAVRMVGEKTGIAVPDTKVRREGPDPREPIWELHATAAVYFQKALWENEIGGPAREYLSARDIPRAIAEEFGIGFAPREIGLMRTYMNALGFDDARMIEAGLLGIRDQETEPRPRFRNRLMFPILDTLGRNVGFGGRILGDGEPKYLNSAESPVFSKGKLLFALSRSRNAIRRANRALIVEGYFDALRLMASGVEEVVAPLGTALTEAQATLLGKYSKNVFLLYDSDAAGLKATFRTGDELLRQRFSVRVVTLPPGEDPDTFVRAKGAAGLEAQLTAALDVFERKIQILDRAGWFSELQKKRRALDRLLPTLRATADPIMRDLYIARASGATGVDRAILLRELGVPVAQSDIPALAHSMDARGGAAHPKPAGRQDAPRIRGRGISSERELVRAMLIERSRVERIAESVGPDTFRHPNYRVLFAALIRAGEETPLNDVTTGLRAEDIAVIEDLLAEPDAQPFPDQTIEDSILQLHLRDIEDRQYEIQRLSPLASPGEQALLNKELLELQQERRKAGKGLPKAFHGRSR